MAQAKAIKVQVQLAASPFGLHQSRCSCIRFATSNLPLPSCNELP